MRTKALTGIACAMALLVSGAGLSGLSRNEAAQRDQPALTRHFTGLINDYGPSAAVVNGGPYEMRGTWSLVVNQQRGTASFSAALNMETSDFGIVQGTVNKDIPASRGAHTHHISLMDGVVTDDWPTACPAFSPPITDGFVVTGSAVVTGNGSNAPFGNPSQLTVCVLGGSRVRFSNVTLLFETPASKHFGTQAIHGVVTACTGKPRGVFPPDCTVQ
jgi:hypothetical protein